MATEASRKAPTKASGPGPAAAGNPPAEPADPIIVNLGKKKRKAIRRLRRGRGRLMDDVLECVEDLRDEQRIEGDVQPVVFIVRQKRRGKGRKSMRRLFRI